MMKNNEFNKTLMILKIIDITRLALVKSLLLKKFWNVIIIACKNNVPPQIIKYKFNSSYKYK